jgi:chromosome segregation ATPase
LVEKRHVRYKAKHDKLKFRSAGHKQRLEHLEQQAEDIQEAIAAMGSELASDTGDVSQQLVDKIKSMVKDQVRLTWQGAALEMAHKKRDMDNMLHDQDRQLVDLRTQVERQERASASHKQVKDTAQKMGELLDRQHLNQQREMENLRATVAAQASIIKEQGKHIAQMRQQICGLTEKQNTVRSGDSNGLWSKGYDGQWRQDNSLLWSPQR